MAVCNKNIILALTVAIGCTTPSVADNHVIKMGGLATLEGAFTVLGEDGMRGVELALREFNYSAGGKKIELITGSSDASPDSAIRAARKLVEQDEVQILIGPLSGSEGLALKDYAKTKPRVTFLKRRVSRTRHNITRLGAEFFPFFHRRCAVDGRARRICLSCQGVSECRDHWRGLFISIHSSARVYVAVL